MEYFKVFAYLTFFKIVLAKSKEIVSKHLLHRKKTLSKFLILNEMFDALLNFSEKLFAVENLDC